MKSPPKMPQRAMVRIWVASLHQKLQRREDAGVFLLSETFQSISKGGFEQLRPGALRPAGQKQPARLFLAARLATSTRAHQKSSTYESALNFLFCTIFRRTQRVDENSCGAVAKDSAKTALRAVFSSAARVIHPRPPRNGT